MSSRGRRERDGRRKSDRDQRDEGKIWGREDGNKSIGGG